MFVEENPDRKKRSSRLVEYDIYNKRVFIVDLSLGKLRKKMKINSDSDRFWTWKKDKNSTLKNQRRNELIKELNDSRLSLFKVPFWTLIIFHQ